MPVPFAAGLAVRGLGGLARRFAGRALRALTRGRLIGQGGGAIAAGRIGTGIAVAATANEVVQAARRRAAAGAGTSVETYDKSRGGSEFGRTYRRMNPMNVRALRRSVRRINSAERLFRKVFTITKGQVNVRKARRAS